MSRQRSFPRRWRGSIPSPQGSAREWVGSPARLIEHEGGRQLVQHKELSPPLRLALQAGVTQPPDDARIGVRPQAMTPGGHQRVQTGAPVLLEKLRYA
jgi:hypothetical protein